jgi:hypothetical protein
MTSANPVPTTVIACLAMALTAVLLAAVLGRFQAGLSLAAGLVIGSANGFFAMRALSSGLSFRATSTARLAVLTAAAVGCGLLIGGPFWLAVLGVGLAQLVLAGVAARGLLRR